ncbi:N utilization substance protein B [Polymorphobacter multimanifer]|uniref:Transcription antitermination protein NusB n=1 Tax=Polymorphobacter multimanifer TaxID=1070431 RepID=A0A841LAE2_9SPHN|nr:transcription antitermination factor NusB [Polymorphobacter multimanifer]MBB6226122.1 N utilization substance protein B [Polymorphobacter multimanifer]GGI71870.1 N utilization substance protein B [Polymorphobacter multimanifer]
MSKARTKSPANINLARGAARLGAVQALYQQAMTGDTIPRLLNEFHHHRLGESPDGAGPGVEMAEADVAFFDDLVMGASARAEELDGLVAGALAAGWTLERLDRPMQALLRLATYELVARADVSAATVIEAYVALSKAFHDDKQAGFVNGLLDTVARQVRG